MTKENKEVRTRIAPSPTGDDIHIGNLYTALINWVFAKKNNGKFVIRIEDTDRERLVEGSSEKILKTLKDYGLDYDEGPKIGGPFAPYIQSERLELYKNFAQDLIKKGFAYYCFCSPQRLTELREQQLKEKKDTKYDRHCLLHEKNPEERIKKGDKFVIRLKVSDNEEISFKDLIRGEIKFNSNNLDDQILIKSDGFPTYHMAVVTDDHLMEISHVIRAEEWISSTPKHILLYKAFGWDLPIFAHMPILRNPDRSKLSKRKNPVWASWYLSEGFLPEAVINYLALMGWSHPEEKEIFSLTEFMDLFKLEDVNPVGPVFDINKLSWMNGVYIREKLTTSELIERLIKYNQEIANFRDDPKFRTLVDLAKTRISTLQEFFEVSNVYFKNTGEVSSEKEKSIVNSLINNLNAVKEWKKEEIFICMKNVMDKEGIKMPILYKVFTGKEKGLPLPEIMEMIGEKEVIKRLKDLLG